MAPAVGSVDRCLAAPVDHTPLPTAIHACHVLVHLQGPGLGRAITMNACRQLMDLLARSYNLGSELHTNNADQSPGLLKHSELYRLYSV
jgi:hypothetical protein